MIMNPIYFLLYNLVYWLRFKKKPINLGYLKKLSDIIYIRMMEYVLIGLSFVYYHEKVREGLVAQMV